MTLQYATAAGFRPVLCAPYSALQCFLHTVAIVRVRIRIIQPCTVLSFQIAAISDSCCRTLQYYHMAVPVTQKSSSRRLGYIYCKHSATEMRGMPASLS